MKCSRPSAATLARMDSTIPLLKCTVLLDQASVVQRRMYFAPGGRSRGMRHFALKLSGVAAFVMVWALAVQVTRSLIVPGPWAVVRAIWELAERGLLFKYAVASLFR